MRNWNLNSPFSNLIASLSFEPTYEELKQYRTKDNYTKRAEFWAYLWGIETWPNLTDGLYASVFWAYLWGIETPYKRKPQREEGQVLSLPMRNWNEATSLQAQQENSGFEPTYEELKHSFI